MGLKKSFNQVGQINQKTTGQKKPALKTVQPVKSLFYVGSPEFMEEREWIQRWRNVNPIYDQGFIVWCIPKLKGIEYYSTKGVTEGTVKQYFHKGNHDTPESKQRAGDIAVWWEEYQAQKVSASKVIYEVIETEFDRKLRGDIPA